MNLTNNANRKEVEIIIMRVSRCRSYVKRILKKRDQDVFWKHYQDLLKGQQNLDYEFTNHDVGIARELENILTCLFNTEASLNTLFKFTS